MESTPVYGLRYPVLTDPPRGDEQLRALAEDTDAATGDLVPDSGLQTLTPVAPAPGWTVLVLSHRTIGKVCSLFVSLRRDGAAIQATAFGNIQGDPELATITDPLLRPSMPVSGMFRSSISAGSFYITTGGVLSLRDLHTDSVINQHDDDEGVNSTVQLYAVYPTP